MKYLLILILFPLTIQSQDITEIELQLKKNINTFWTSKKSTLVIELHHLYKIPIQPDDTIRKVFIQIFNESYETQGISSGVSLFGVGRLFGSSVSASKIEKLVKEKEFLYLEKEAFLKMLKGMNNIYTYLKAAQIGDRNTKPFIATYEDENLKFGGSLNPDSEFNKYTFYLKYNDAIFSMSDAEFVDIYKFMNQVRDSLNKK